MQLRSRRNRDRRRWRLPAVSLLALALVAAGCGGSEAASERAGDTAASRGALSVATGAQLSGAKRFLGQHTDRLVGFTEKFRGSPSATTSSPRPNASISIGSGGRRGGRGRAVAAADEGRMDPGQPVLRAGRGDRCRDAVAGRVRRHPRRRLERAEDPQSAVPFDLTLSDGTVLKQPGNLYNLTEGALWGTLPKELRRPGAPADLDGDGTREFGEILPDPGLLSAASETLPPTTRKSSTPRARPGSRPPRMRSPPSS